MAAICAGRREIATGDASATAESRRMSAGSGHVMAGKHRTFALRGAVSMSRAPKTGSGRAALSKRSGNPASTCHRKSARFATVQLAGATRSGRPIRHH
jgi:hypothetical protein